MTPAGREVLHGIILDMYDQFVGMVAAGRKMEPEAVRALADGRAYTGRQALKLGLIDAIGEEQDARTWLEKTKGLTADLPVEEVTGGGLASRMAANELAPFFDGLWKTLISQSVRLDGPWAVWQR